MSKDRDAPPFPGFERPEKNYYRLPNDWFDLWAWVRAQMKARGMRTNQLGAIIKWLEFLLKHSWGYLNFNVPIRLTNDEFEQGRRQATQDGSRGARMDGGTGLSSRTLAKIPDLLLELGLITLEKDESDPARVKHWFLPRLNPDPDQAVRTPFPTTDTFEGFDFPESNWFSVPFEWTDLTREIGSAIEILSAEYLMRHTFGWRDAVRWLTPVEIATGRQRSDGSTYDNGIQYDRNPVAKACKRLAEKGLLVWRPAQREIGRETREYALRMQGMAVDEETGEWLDVASDGEVGQSKALVVQSKALVGQSKGSERGQSTPQLGQSKALRGQSKALVVQSKPLVGQSTPRSDIDTSLQHLPQNQRPKPTTTPPSPAAPSLPPPAQSPRTAADALSTALKDVGINGRKRKEILALEDPPAAWAVYGWVYWAHAQEWTDRNPVGAAINRLLDPETRHAVPRPFDDLGREHGGPVIAALALRAGYRLAGYTPPYAEALGDVETVWRQHFGRCPPHRLPLPNPAAALWTRECDVLQRGLDRPVSPEDDERWQQAWRDVLATDAPLPPELQSAGSRALGYYDGRLVVLVSDPVARVVIEEVRANLETELGTEIQFTAVEVRAPQLFAEDRPEASEAAQVWSRISGELQLGMTMAAFHQGFGRCKALALDDGCLTLQLPDEYLQQWIIARLQGTLSSAVKAASADLSSIALFVPQTGVTEIVQVSH